MHTVTFDNYLGDIPKSSTNVVFWEWPSRHDNEWNMWNRKQQRQTFGSNSSTTIDRQIVQQIQASYT